MKYQKYLQAILLSLFYTIILLSFGFACILEAQDDPSAKDPTQKGFSISSRTHSLSAHRGALMALDHPRPRILVSPWDQIEQSLSHQILSAPAHDLVTSGGQLYRAANSLSLDSVSEAWSAYYTSNQYFSWDWTKAIALDSSDGSVVVTGKSAATFSGYDFCTIKYSSNGTVLWTVRYNGPGNFRDEPSDVAIDASGNVYVTGWTFGDTTSEYDYTTIKYSSSGVQQWIARYDGTGNGLDYAKELAVDTAGNVYVAGYSAASNNKYDYATVKYSSLGVQQWVARYDSPADSDDMATDIALDGAGNVYVTGSSFDPTSSYDYLTIKYNSSGIEQWITRYNDLVNDTDRAADVSVDAAGNVYVTGTSEGSVSGADYATVKYDSSGVQQWVRQYNGSANGTDQSIALALDGDANVCVTGGSYGSSGFDYATVKYDSAGNEKWVARYTGTGSGGGLPNAIAVDAAKNVYVTGIGAGVVTMWDCATVKYDSSGAEQWVARYDGPIHDEDMGNDIAVDGTGNVYVAGRSWYTDTTAYDYMTVKYNSSGNQQWATTHDGPETTVDHVTAVNTDDGGNIYVTGYLYNRYSGYNYVTVKYNPGGVQQWVAQYEGPSNSSSLATAAAVDHSGNVYVTGYYLWYDATSNMDFLTVKYNTDGVLLWEARYGSGDVGYPCGIDLDSAGNVYISGYGDAGMPTIDYITIKYSPSGVEQWVARYNHIGEDAPFAMTVDDAGNVYVTGASSDGGSSWDCGTVKYNTSGVEQWRARYNGPPNHEDRGRAITVDQHGNVYVTGESTGKIVPPDTLLDYITVKYNSDGVEQWVSRYNGPADRDDQARSVGADGTGNVFVTGYSTNAMYNWDIVTVKYDSNGHEEWNRLYNGPADGADVAYDLDVDQVGNVYIAGSSQSSSVGGAPGDTTEQGMGNGNDFLTIKYNSAGQQHWLMRYNGIGNGDDGDTRLVLDRFGNVIVAGSSAVNASSWIHDGFCTVKYEQGVIRRIGVDNGWNMLSIPLYVDDYRKESLFPTAISRAFAYEGTYQPKDTLQHGAGYWLKFSDAQLISLSGFQLITDTVDVDEGWNMIGSISSAIPTSFITSDPSGMIASKFFRYRGNYETTDTLDPGSGYWVKVNQVGQLVLSSSGLLTASNRIKIIPTSELPPLPPDEKFTTTQATPTEFVLEQNYPNPFNPVTIINYQLPIDNYATLKVYNLLGQEVATLVDEFQTSGFKSIEWYAVELPSGLYYYRLVAGDFTCTKKLLILR